MIPGYPKKSGGLLAVPGRCFEKESVLPIYVSVPSFPEAAPRASRASKAAAGTGAVFDFFCGHDEGK